MADARGMEAKLAAFEDAIDYARDLELRGLYTWIRHERHVGRSVIIVTGMDQKFNARSSPPLSVHEFFPLSVHTVKCSKEFGYEDIV